MDTLTITLQFILSLSILIITHEAGHFFFAKLFGVKVDKFYMFFNPCFSLFKYQPDGPQEGADTKPGLNFFRNTLAEEEVEIVLRHKFESAPQKYLQMGRDTSVLSESHETKILKNKEVVEIHRRRKGGFSLVSYVAKPQSGDESGAKKRWWHGTDFGLGWLPLGGYCSIVGMIDETQKADKLAATPQPYEFRSKKSWQRLLIMLGGVLVNAVTAPLIFWGVLFTWGETYMPISQAPMGLSYHEVMREVGFQDGDLITAVNGEPVETYKDIANGILFGDSCIVEFTRNGQRQSLRMPHEFFRTILSRDVQMLCTIRIPTVVDSVVPGTPAFEAGMVRGDSIVAVADTVTPSFSDLTRTLAKHAGQLTPVMVYRQFKRSAAAPDTLFVRITEEGKAGFLAAHPTRWIKFKTREYGFFEALPAGMAKGWDMLSSYVKQLPLIFTREGASKVGGFGTIAQLFPGQWDWMQFWVNTAFLAIILAVMNVLPIPALDGGHVLFLLAEVVTGRKVPDRFLETAQTIGMLLLLALIVYANANDVVRFLIKPN